METAQPPAALMAARRLSALAASRPTRTTLAPAWAKAWAMALQSSPVPPGTTATSPLSENCSSRNEVMLYPQQGWRLYGEAWRDYNRCALGAEVQLSRRRRSRPSAATRATTNPVEGTPSASPQPHLSRES